MILMDQIHLAIFIKHNLVAISAKQISILFGERHQKTFLPKTFFNLTTVFLADNTLALFVEGHPMTISPKLFIGEDYFNFCYLAKPHSGRYDFDGSNSFSYFHKA